MKKYIITTLFLFLLSVAFTAVQAQNDDNDSRDKKEKKNKKDKISIKIDKNDIPSFLSPGQSFNVNFTIKNNSKKEEWNFSGLTYEIDQPYSGRFPMTDSYITIPPGEEKSFSITITAPYNEGKEKLRMTFYNDGKKKKQLVKTINIGNNGSRDIKQGDDNTNKNDDNSNVNGNKDKDKDKDKNKNKNKENNSKKEKDKKNND